MDAKPDLMKMACNFARTHPSEIFRTACVWSISPNRKCWCMKEWRREWDLQTAKGKGEWDEWVLDTCLDILAKRLPLFVEFEDEKGRYRIYLVYPLTMLTPPQLWKFKSPEEWREEFNGGY